jgi:CBS domain-containing protein
VLTCGPDEDVDRLMATMTEHRVRHVPVLDNGQLCGIVSIGDVVKSRIDELERHRRELEDYITAR